MSIKFTRYHLDPDGQLVSELVEYEPDDTLAEQRGVDNYTKLIRGYARLVWQGLDAAGIGVDPYGDMSKAVDLGIKSAWREGAASCGISEDELTPEELSSRNKMISDQQSYITTFLNWVYEHRRDGPDKLPWRTITARVNTWGNAYNRAYHEAKARACADQKMRWRLHGRRVTKESCVDCLKMDGRVYRASIWAKYSIFPQSPDLKCSGMNCGCSWEEVDASTPANRGRPPRLSGQR